MGKKLMLYKEDMNKILVDLKKRKSILNCIPSDDMGQKGVKS